MLFNVQNALVALAATALVGSVAADPIPLVGESGALISRATHKHAKLHFNAKTAQAAGQGLLTKAKKMTSDKSTWPKEKTYKNWTVAYGPDAKDNFKPLGLNSHDIKWLKGVTDTDFKPADFVKFVVFSRNGKKNGTFPQFHSGNHTHSHSLNGTHHGHSLNGTHHSHSKNGTVHLHSHAKNGTEHKSLKGKFHKIAEKFRGKNKQHKVHNKHGKHGKHVHAHNKHPRLPVLVAAYSPKAIIIKSLHKSHDHNKLTHQLRSAELLYQGAVATNSKATVFIREAPTGKIMKTMIKHAKVVAKKNGGSLKADSKNKKVQKQFQILLGAPTGRAIMRMCLAHPSYYQGKYVKEIQIKGAKGHESVIYIVS